MNRVYSLESFAARLLCAMRGAPAIDPADTNAPNTSTAACADWERQFNDLALELFLLQFEQNAAYRRVCQSRRIDASSIRDWREIPAVGTSAFKELEFSCIASEERTAVFLSSGTTGQRASRHFHHRKSLEVYETSLLAWFKVAMDKAIPTRGLALTPSGREAPNSSLVHMFQTLRSRAGFKSLEFTGHIGKEGAWMLNNRATVEWLQEAIRIGQPVLLLGTAFSYVHLLDYLSENNLSWRLPAGSRVLETGGYKGRSRILEKSELHLLMSRYLGVKGSDIISEYGMSELSSQAYAAVWDSERREDTKYFRFPPWAEVRVISPENGREVGEGQKGLLQVFDLANVYSVMAIQTEDLGIRRGKGFEMLGRATAAEPRGCSLMAVD